VTLAKQVPEHCQNFCQWVQLGKFLARVQDPSGKCWPPLGPLSEVALARHVPEHAQFFCQGGHVGELQARLQPFMENDGLHGLMYLRLILPARSKAKSRFFWGGQFGEKVWPSSSLDCNPLVLKWSPQGHDFCRQVPRLGLSVYKH